tara:strand:+ start:531 stop:1508 length:978 start_codon:yes stop_codon:yes gene_type:complete
MKTRRCKSCISADPFFKACNPVAAAKMARGSAALPVLVQPPIPPPVPPPVPPSVPPPVPPQQLNGDDTHGGMVCHFDARGNIMRSGGARQDRGGGGHGQFAYPNERHQHGCGDHQALSVPSAVAALIAERQSLRRVRNWAAAEVKRREIEARGFIVDDRGRGVSVRRPYSYNANSSPSERQAAVSAPAYTPPPARTNNVHSSTGGATSSLRSILSAASDASYARLLAEKHSAQMRDIQRDLAIRREADIRRDQDTQRAALAELIVGALHDAGLNTLEFRSESLKCSDSLVQHVDERTLIADMAKQESRTSAQGGAEEDWQSQLEI